MKKILLCAFDAFGGEKINPALEASKLVRAKGVLLEICEVPTVFYKSINTVTQKIDEFTPDAVIMLGQAGGRDKITPERVAINVSDARISDNEGNQPTDEPVIKGAPAAYFSTLPIKAIAERLSQEGIPAAISNSAGTFVCNHLMYGVLRHVSTNKLNAIAGFVHVPYLPEQVRDRENTPSLSLKTDVKAIGLIIEEVVKYLEEKEVLCQSSYVEA